MNIQERHRGLCHPHPEISKDPPSLRHKHSFPSKVALTPLLQWVLQMQITGLLSQRCPLPTSGKWNKYVRREGASHLGSTGVAL